MIITDLSVIASDGGISASDKRKSEYIYLEAVNQLSLDNYGGFYDLMNRAYELDSTNNVIAYYYGYSKLFNMGNSNEDIKNHLNLMRRLADTPSESIDEVAAYASLQNRFGNYEEAIRVWSNLQDNNPEDIDIMINLAESYVNSNNAPATLAQYNKIEESIGRTQEISLRKVSIYLMLNDSVNAVAEGLALLNDAPENSINLQIMGNIYDKLGATDSTLVYYKRAAEVNPEDGYINLSLAELYSEIGDTLNYDIQVEKLLISKEVEVEDKLKFLEEHITDLLKNESNTDKVNELFSMLLDTHPHQGKIHQLYGDFFLVLTDFDSALEQISYQLDQDPANADVWQKMMFVALMAENYEKAKYAAEKSIYYNPEEIELYTYIAPIYMQLGDYEKSVELYNIAIEKVDKDNMSLQSSLHGGLGDVYQFSGDTISAIERYEVALKLDSGNLMVLNNYAYLLAEMGEQLELAERMSRLTIQENPENYSSLDTYAWIMFKMERYADALKYIELSAKYTEEPSSELLEHYGDILFMVGVIEGAVERWKQAAELDPESEILKIKIKERRYIAK